MPTLADAVYARTLSALKRERIAAAAVLAGPAPTFRGERTTFVEAIRQALCCSKICCLRPGLPAPGAPPIALTTGGCGRVPSRRSGAPAASSGHSSWARSRRPTTQTPSLANLLLDGYFASVTAAYQQAWRQVVAVAAENGVPVPAFMSALAYYDGYRSALLPANLLQAQRDFFGAHTYQRIDRAGTFHTEWKE